MAAGTAATADSRAEEAAAGVTPAAAEGSRVADGTDSAEGSRAADRADSAEADTTAAAHIRAPDLDLPTPAERTRPTIQRIRVRRTELSAR
jgi:hypothetical protein